MPSVADLVVERLRGAGVRFLFGVPGGGSNLDLIAAAERAGLRFVLTATETGGAIAALAQSEVTRRPGACLTTLGPGVASVVNGVACARLERAPVIVFTDAPAADTAFAHQRLDHRALMEPVTKWSVTLTPDNADAVMVRALDHARADPPGPVHIDCPADVLSKSVAPPRDGGGFEIPALADASESPAGPDLPGLQRSERPLIVLGLGARDEAVSSTIRTLCASHRIPAMVTYKAKGVIADRDPWFAGVFTNGAIEKPIVDAADLILAVGLDAVELLPRAWTYRQAAVRVGASQIGSLSEWLRPSTWDLAEVQGMVGRQRDAACVPTRGLAPHRVIQIAALAAGPARVSVDAGAHMFPATVLWPVDAPNQMLISNGLSTMGFALPAAVGAALADGARAARGGRRVVALTGDGGLLMCTGELATIARERLPIVVIVFDDRALSLIDVKQQQRRLARSGVDMGAVDWRGLAESVGICGWSVESEEAFAAALTAALRLDGPTLIDARVDASGYSDIVKAVRG
jgi:acetolactate synthase-1/2/3 large subunit